MAPERIPPERIPDLLRPGMRVFVAGCLGESGTVRAALQAAPEAARGVTFCGVLVPGLSSTDYAGLHPEARGESFFLPPWQRESFEAGRLRLLPLNYSAIPDYLEHGPRFDLAIVQVAADGAADFGFGACADFQAYALRNGFWPMRTRFSRQHAVMTGCRRAGSTGSWKQTSPCRSSRMRHRTRCSRPSPGTAPA